MSFINIVITIGVASIVLALIYIGKKLQVLDNLVETTSKIKINVKVISDHLTSSSTDFNHTELQAYSPLELTEAGRKLIAELGFDNVFTKHKDDFCRFIEDERPRLKYDVEKAAIKTVAALSGKNYMNFLKVYFYNNPTRTISNLAPTLGIYVRDKYLEDHPEITE
jgi:HJR/Mrr/RecB family endonuclease